MKADKNTEIFKTEFGRFHKQHFDFNAFGYDYYKPQITTCSETLAWQTKRIKELTEDFLKATKNVLSKEYDTLSNLHWTNIKSIINLK